jgi:hypothetical protein
MKVTYLKKALIKGAIPLVNQNQIQQRDRNKFLEKDKTGIFIRK